jgi:hypothetical protein
VGDGSGRTWVPDGPPTGAAWVGETFGATGERPTGAVTVGDWLGATDGGLVKPEDPPEEGAGADVPDDAPEEDPPEEDPPEADPPDDPVCANAMAGINNEAARITTRTAYSRPGPVRNSYST